MSGLTIRDTTGSGMPTPGPTGQNSTNGCSLFGIFKPGITPEIRADYLGEASGQGLLYTLDDGIMGRIAGFMINTLLSNRAWAKGFYGGRKDPFLRNPANCFGKAVYIVKAGEAVVRIKDQEVVQQVLQATPSGITRECSQFRCNLFFTLRLQNKRQRKH